LIIALFIKNNPIYNNNKFKVILNRKFLKNIIMIVNYNAGKKKCFENLKFILNNNNIYIEDGDLKSFVEHFHDYLNNDLFSILFLKNKETYIKDIGYRYLCKDGSSINLAYQEHKIIKNDIKIKEFR